MIYYNNARDAILYASHDNVNFFVGYAQGKGWHRYNPLQGCPEGSVPEFMCSPGKLPIPLSEIAIDVLVSLLLESAKRLKL